MEPLRLLTNDGEVGYDKFNQLIWRRRQSDYIGSDYLVSNFIADVRGKTCLICGRGWELTGKSMGDQLFWRLAEENVHQSCMIRYEGLGERERYYAALYGVTKFRGLKPIENGYWSSGDPWSAKPWYSAELFDHPARIEIGRRKHVDSIEVVPEGGTSLAFWEEAKVRFADEQVTKEFSPGGCLVHSWSSVKTRQYIETLMTALDFQIK
jgi:hypothetical protein